MTDIFIYFSDILGIDVVDCNDEKIGKLHDIAMRIGGEVYPRASNLIVKKGMLTREFAQVPWNVIENLNDVVRLNIKAEDISFQKERFKNDLSLCMDVLDQQVVDIDHQKVVRVNDVHLFKVDSQLYLAHVDVGIRGLVRRLEWTKFVDSLVRLLTPRSPYLTKEELITWKNTQVLTLGRTKNVLRLAVARKKLSQIPPTELAEIMEDLDIFEKCSLFRSLEKTVQRKVFADLALDDQEELVDQLDDNEAVELLENIPSDDAVDLLLKLPKVKTLQFMKRMGTKTSNKLSKLLGFEKDSAGGLMTTEYLSLSKTATVKEAMQKIKDNIQYPGSIYYVYLVDENNRFAGTTTLRRFINVDENTPLAKTCYRKKIFVRIDDEVEKIALILEKYKFSAMPVLDEKNVLQGVITIDDVMEQLISLAWAKYKEKL